MQHLFRIHANVVANYTLIFFKKEDFWLFQELMLDNAKMRNVIEATSKPQLFEKLDSLQKRFLLISTSYQLETHCLKFLV